MTQEANTEMDKEVRSFVSFALAMKPTVTFHSNAPGQSLTDTSVTVKFDDTVDLRDTDLTDANTTTLETLLQKYEPIREFLQNAHPLRSVDGFDIMNSFPTVKFQPNVRYQMVQINATQLEIAKEVARLTELTYNSHKAGDQNKAKTQFDDLQSYLSQKRDELVGDFKKAGRISDTIGLHGTGQAGHPEVYDAGMAAFVIIEIIINK
jgi:hypothetical protein